MRPPHVALLALLAFAPFAGCLSLDGDGGGEAPDVRTPRATLEASRDVAWSGEPIAFDARNSTDPDGSVARWVFDFGDGTRVEVTDPEEARVEHTYERGGDYRVTVTVFDNGTGQGGALSDGAEVAVSVNERHAVAAQVLDPASPADGNGSAPTSRHNRSFDAREGAEGAALNVTVSNPLPLGSSRVALRLLGPDGAALAERTVTVDAGASSVVDFAATLADAGAYALEIVAESGGATVEGDLAVYYAAPDDGSA